MFFKGLVALNFGVENSERPMSSHPFSTSPANVFLLILLSVGVISCDNELSSSSMAMVCESFEAVDSYSHVNVAQKKKIYMLVLNNYALRLIKKLYLYDISIRNLQSVQYQTVQKSMYTFNFA